MPPSEASAPGSSGKNRPWSRRCSLSCLRVMPGSTTQSRSCGVHRQHAVHVAEVDRDAAEGRVDVAFERGAGAERDHRHAMGGADAHDVLHVFGRLREHHRVGRLVRDPGRGVGVLLAHRLRGDQPVAEFRRQRGDRRLASPRIGAPAVGRFRANGSILTWLADRLAERRRRRQTPSVILGSRAAGSGRAATRQPGRRRHAGDRARRRRRSRAESAPTRTSDAAQRHLQRRPSRMARAGAGPWRASR